MEHTDISEKCRIPNILIYMENSIKPSYHIKIHLKDYPELLLPDPLATLHYI